MSTLVFDMADPGVKKMVDGWADNTEYTATVTVMTGAGPQRNVGEVTSFEPEDAPVEEEMEEAAPPPPEKKTAAKPAGKVEY